MPTQKKCRDSIHAKGTEIAVLSTGDSNDYILLTDIARYKSDAPDDVIKNWMHNRDTIEFLGLWEQLNNPDFNPVEFDGVRMQTGSNAFTMSPKKWIEATGAIGIVSKSWTLSKRIYDMMDGGKKIFSQEGIAEALPILQRIQNTVAFSHDDVQSVYEFEDDCTGGSPLLKLLP